jgi:uncharacterized protein (DUF58 family)
MKYHYLTVAFLVALAVLAAGCTGGGSTNATTTAPTAGQTTAAATAVTTAAELTVQTLPAGQTLAVSVNRQPYNREIEVSFNGGSGQGAVRALEATVNRADGTTESKALETRSGSEATFKGSSGADTVYVKATLTNGNTYVFFKQVLP